MSAGQQTNPEFYSHGWREFLCVLCILALGSLTATSAYARPGGVSGHTTTATTCAHSGCHTGTADYNPSLSLGLPSSVVAGRLYDGNVSASIGEPTIDRFGFNLSHNGNGTFSETGTSLELNAPTPDLGVPPAHAAVLGQLTHSELLAEDTDYPFRWRAPTSPRSVSFNWCINAVNENDSSAGDDPECSSRATSVVANSAPRLRFSGSAGPTTQVFLESASSRRVVLNATDPNAGDYANLTFEVRRFGGAPAPELPFTVFTIGPTNTRNIQLTYTGNTRTTYVITATDDNFTATTSDDLTTTHRLTLDINPEPEARLTGDNPGNVPDVGASPIQVSGATSVNFDSSVSGASAVTPSYAWRLIEDATVGIDGCVVQAGSVASTASTFTVSSFPDVGATETRSFTIELAVTDAAAQKDCSTRTYTVSDQFADVLPVIAPFSVNGSLNEGSEVTIDADVNKPIADADAVWTSVPGLTLTGTGLTRSFTYTEPDTNAVPSFDVTLTVTDDIGRSTNRTQTITINNGPTANAGAAQTVNEGDSIVLNGSASFDPEDAGLTYAWSPAGQLTGADTASPTFVPASIPPGGLTQAFTLTVTDPGGLTASATTSVTVSNVNAAPVALAGADAAADEGSLVMLSGAIDDPDDAAATGQFSWVSSDPTLVLSDASAAAPTFTAPQVSVAGGSATFTLVVTDDEGLQSAPDDVLITFTNLNQPPSADAGAVQTVAENEVVTLNASNSDDDDDRAVLTYLWTQVPHADGLIATLSDASIAMPTFVAPEVGFDNSPVFTFEVQVADTQGLFDTDTVVVNVSNTNLPPNADAGPDQRVPEETLVSLTGENSSDPDTAIDDTLSFSWMQTSGPAVVLSDPSVVAPTFPAPQVAITGAALEFELTVTDRDGLVDTDTVVLNVSNVNQPPVAEASPPQTVNEGDAVTVDALNSFDPDGGALGFAWQQVSGVPVTLSDPSASSVSFVVPSIVQNGTIRLRVTVTGNEGLMASDETIINVVDANAEVPIANAGADQSVAEFAVVVLDGSGSGDPDGVVESFLWTQTAGPAVQLSNPNSVAPSFSAPGIDGDSATLIFDLEIIDNSGLTAMDRIMITITTGSEAPVAQTGGDVAGTEGATVQLGVADTTSGHTFMWRQVSGPAVVLSDPGISNPTFVLPPIDDASVQNIVFELVVTNALGTSVTEQVTITSEDNGVVGVAPGLVSLLTAEALADPIGVDVVDGSLVSIEAIASTDTRIAGNDNRPELLPYGLFDFSIRITNPGASASITLHFDQPLATDGWAKYTADGGWQDISDQVVISADRMQATLTIVDGGNADDDGLANGLIVDPSGPATFPAPVTAAPATLAQEAPRSSSGGGCSVGAPGQPVGPILPGIVIFALLYLWRRRLRWLLASSLLVLGACGGGGGSSSQEEPIAAAFVVAQGQSLSTVKVRAGSEVVLNGENSDGTRFPIQNAQWRQTDTSGIVVRFDKRTEYTRAFRVPIVDTETTLSFELEVENTDGERSISAVDVVVVPSNDSNRFLEFFRNQPDIYTVVAALKQGVRTTSDVSFKVIQKQSVNYADRTNNSKTPNRMDVEITTPIERSSLWLDGTVADWTTVAQATGGATGIEGANAYYHPNLTFNIPRLDIDDINVKFDDSADPSGGIEEHQRDTVEHFVDLTLEVTGGSCEDDTGTSIDCQDAATLFVVKANGDLADVTAATDVQVKVGVDELKASTSDIGSPLDEKITPESAATSAAYYAQVDPFDRRTTLNNWLLNAGFINSDGSRIPKDEFDDTLYVNNYDLGFTREMFVRTASDGSVFAYVTNYPALRPAILRKQDPTLPDEDVIATVAMEYGPPDQNADPNAPKFVKFFVYVPNQEGDQVRVNSLNFDGRGEKWIPGACVPCHGGALQSLQANAAGELAYPNFGDIDAAFLPWDLDSFLFVKSSNPELVDPLVTAGFEVNPNYLSPEQLDEFAQAQQEDAFRHMNEAVLETMPTETNAQRERFSLVRQQIHGWYGNADGDLDSNRLPDGATYDASYIQPGWDNVSPEVTAFYSDVFARHCRICHSQIKDINKFTTFADFLAKQDEIFQFVFEDGVMPNARLDMDRLWVDFHGSATPPAHRIADVLGIELTEGQKNGPGLPIARVKGSVVQTMVPRMIDLDLNGQALLAGAQNQNSIRLDGSISKFADQYNWQLTTPAGSSTRLVGETTAKPAFMADVPGEYQATLVVSNSRGTSAPAVITIDAATQQPKAVNASGPLLITDSIPGDERSEVITSDLLNFVDIDTPAAQIVYQVTVPPVHGVLVKTTNGSVETNVTEFTQDDIDGGRVSYLQALNLPEGPSDAFTYEVSDGDSSSGSPIAMQVFNIDILLRNDRPTQLRNGPLPEVPEGGARNLFDASTGAWLNWEDSDDASNAIQFSLRTLPQHGVLRLDATDLGVNDEFTQEDVDFGRLSYVHNGTKNAADSFEYVVTDGKIGVPVDPSEPFPVTITLAAEVPQISTSDVTVVAGLEKRVTGGLDATGPLPTSLNVRVIDADGPQPETITLRVTSQAASLGHLELRNSATSSVTNINSSPGAGETDSFTMADLTDADPNTSVFYVHDQGPTDAGSDSFTLAVTDGTATTVPPLSAVLQVVVGAAAGPTVQGDHVANLNGYLDPVATSATSTATPPFAELVLTGSSAAGDIFVEQGTNALPGQCEVKFRLTSLPQRGKLVHVVGGTRTDLVVNTDFANTARSQVFEQAEIDRGEIVYENTAINANADTFTYVASDCVLETSPQSVTVNRRIDFTQDVGWVIETQWSDAVGTAGVDGGGAACGPRACQDCHVPIAERRCTIGGSRPNWRTARAPSGNLNCSLLKAAFGPLPDYPATVGTGHSGGQVLQEDSFPHDILKQWQIEGFRADGVLCP